MEMNLFYCEFKLYCCYEENVLKNVKKILIIVKRYGILEIIKN